MEKISRVYLWLMIVVSGLLVGVAFYLTAGEEKIGKISYLLINAESKNKSTDEKEVIQPPEERKEIRIVFFGDLMLDRYVGNLIKQNNGIDFIFDGLANAENNLFEGKDLIGANLEGAVTDEGAHYPPNNLYDFAFSPEIVFGLEKYGFNFFNLANNHFADQGQRGVLETRKNLEELGFRFSGCIDGEVGECSATAMEIGGQRIGLVGLSMVYRLFDQIEAENIVRELRKDCDIVIVNIHWGVEYKHEYNLTQQTIGRGLIDAGTDMIIGHHPHVVQGIEIYNGKPIFYSLGNFVFDQYFSEATQESLAVEAIIKGDKSEFILHPLKLKMSQVELGEDENIRQTFFDKLMKWSPESGISGSLKEGQFTL